MKWNFWNLKCSANKLNDSYEGVVNIFQATFFFCFFFSGGKIKQRNMWWKGEKIKENMVKYGLKTAAAIYCSQMK